MTKKGAVATCLAAWCFGIALSVPAFESGNRNTGIPVAVFAGDARGPYRTGTFEELWVDGQRSETATADTADKRHLMVQVWYPAVFKGDPRRAPYALHRALYPHDEEAQWLDDVAAVRTTSVLNAALAPEPAKFPVLIYNPGGSHPPFSATFQTEFLASHGYVVVAIGHTGLTRIERFPDGYVYQADTDDPDAEDPQAAGFSKADRFRLRVQRYTERLMPIHVQDIRFVLDRLQILNGTRGSRFAQRLDLQQVGSLGWSLGGALSLQASRDEARIKAAVNLDGWLYTDVAESGTHRPIMIMHGGDPFAHEAGQTAADRELRLAAESRPWQLFSRTDAPWYDVVLEGAEHEHFSDRMLFEPYAVSRMHPRLVHDIVNRYTLEFFDRFLRGTADTPLLSGEQVYPDVKSRHGPVQ